MDTPGLTPAQVRLMSYQRRFGSTAVSAVITLASVAVSVAMVTMAHLVQGQAFGDMRLELALGVVIPMMITPVASMTALRLVAALDRAYGQLARVASTDDLTGVSTRRHFFDEVARLLASAGRQEQLLVAMVDLDLFKHVNDTWGHAAGDEALQAVARRLSATRPVRSAVGRLGGDEFAFVALVDPDYVGTLRLRLSDALRGLTTQGEVPVGVSIGYAHVPVDAGIDAGLAAADQDLYRIKASRRRRRSDRERPAPSA